MKNIFSYRFSMIASLLSIAFPAVAVTPGFTPYPAVPLHLQPRASEQVPANVLVFIDNSYDGSRAADGTNRPWLPGVLLQDQTFYNATTGQAVSKVDVAKKVVNTIAPQYPKYRWGVSTYTKNNMSLKDYVENGLCFERSDWYNLPTMGCTFVTDFSIKNPSEKLYNHEVGSSLIVPIRDRKAGEFKDFIDGVNFIPKWGDIYGQTGQGDSEAHGSPLTSAYYEMTRYYRGMRSAYNREVPEKARGMSFTWTYNSENTDNTSKKENTNATKEDAENEGKMKEFTAVLKSKTDNIHQYASPIQFRCQTNNIIIITSAADIRGSSPWKDKRGFYQAYHTDPLYKHDNPKYAYTLNDTAGYPKLPSNKSYLHYMVSDWVGEGPSGVLTLAGGEQYYKEAAYLKRYNKVYYPGGKFWDVNKLPSLTKYVRPLDKTHMPIFNPYMDIVEDWSKQKVGAERIKDFNGSYLLNGVSNVFTRNAYNEKTGLESFAHLAHEGDVIAKGSEYIYPKVIEPSAYKATIEHIADSSYGACTGKKCLMYTDRSGNVVVSDKDSDGKAWDGTDDNPRYGEDGKTLIDFSKLYARQHIQTYTVGFGLCSGEVVNGQCVLPKPEDYESMSISKFGLKVGGIEYGDRHQIVFQELNDEDKRKKIQIGDVIFYNNVPLQDPEKNEIIRLTLAPTYWAENEAWHVHTNKPIPENISVGDKLRIVPSKIAAELINPRLTSDVMLKQAAQKGGGIFYSVNQTDEAALSKTLKEILGVIDASITHVAVGSGVATNDTDTVRSAITATLDTERWSSELRFYELLANGDFDATKFKTPDYSKPQYTLINTPNGPRRLSEDETDNGVRLSNASFNIDGSASAVHNGKGGLKVAVSNRRDEIAATATDPTKYDYNEWKSLVKWLNRSTTSDTDPAFKVTINSVDNQQIYRDRDPNKTGHSRHMGDVLDSNILLFGGENGDNAFYDTNVLTDGNTVAKTVRPYMVVGANDGMLHIFKANKRDFQGTNPYYKAFSYIPGTAKREAEDDTIIRNLVYTAEQNYGTKANPHQYFVNGQTFYRRTDSGSQDKQYDDHGLMMIAGSLGQGGRAAYSLKIGGYEYGNVSDAAQRVGLDSENSSSWAKTIPMWDTSTNQFGDPELSKTLDHQLGYIIGRPQIGRISKKGLTGITMKLTKDNKEAYDGYMKQLTFNGDSGADIRYATFLSSGFNPPPPENGKNPPPTLYVLDQLGRNVAIGADTAAQEPAGKLLASIPTTLEATDIHSGLAAPVFVDLDFNGITDLVYAGDQNGNMWRFDLRDDIAKWKAKKIFSGSPNKPITTAPDIFYNKDAKGERMVIVTFGTGSVLYQDDFTSTDVQSMYGIFDRVDSCKDNNIGLCQAAKESDLLKQSIVKQAKGTIDVIGDKKIQAPYRFVSEHKHPNLGKERGWQLDLVYNNQKEGERVVVVPTVLTNKVGTRGSVIFSTRIFKDANKDDAKPSCTPPPVTINSWIMALDVRTGGNPSAVHLNHKVGGKPIASLGVYGAASGLTVATSGTSEINSQGRGKDGVAVRLGEEVQREVMCGPSGSVEGVIAIQQPNGGTLLRTIVACGANYYHRVSWREVF